jgi:hypothetical protein
MMFFITRAIAKVGVASAIIAVMASLRNMAAGPQKTVCQSMPFSDALLGTTQWTHR